MFKSICFAGLYPYPEDQSKINLTSLQFYLDTFDFYCKNETKREMLIKGFIFLAYLIKDVDELDDIIRLWEGNKIRFLFAGQKLIKFSSKEIVNEFLSQVPNILDTRRINIVDRKRKEIERLRAKSKKDQIIIDSLTKTQKVALIAQPQKDLDISSVLLRVKYDKLGLIKKRAGNILQELYKKELLSKSKDKEFAAISLILYKTLNVISTPTFSEWLKILSAACNRPTSNKYKPKDVRERMAKIETKYPFLNPPLSEQERDVFNKNPLH